MSACWIGLSISTTLMPNMPNPFNPQTMIRFRVGEAGPVRVAIYDVTGRLVRTLVDGQMGRGEQGVTWQGRDDSGRTVSSGAYYVRLDTGSKIDQRKIMLMK